MARQAIVIIHHIGSKGWLEDCLDSIDTTYPIIITNHKGWCMNGIQKVIENTDYDEYCILNESMIVKDNSIWDIIFKEHKGKSVQLGIDYTMFMGKFIKEHILPFPDVKTKRDDVLLGEDQWGRGYGRLQIEHIMLDPLHDTYQVFEEKNGRNNMVLENQWFKKFKGHWNLDMV
jgi:hypothetical protein